VIGTLASPTRLTITVNAVAPSEMNGSLYFNFGVVKDVSEAAGVRAFGAPLPYAAGDRVAGSAWLST
jgi:hypothetical protein